MGKVIAIDGPSGAGKSTLARSLALRLGFDYLDTGAIYRAVALFFLERGIRPEDGDDLLVEALHSSGIRFSGGKVFLGERDVSGEIRTPEVGHYSSVFSARKVVRDFLLDVQRSAASRQNVVVEGRDTTTVVFPKAWKKFYLDASTAERTRRRHDQLRDLGLTITEDEAERDVVERDRRDQSRGIAPLVKGEDAVIIDTTDKSAEVVLENILELVRSDP
ncbi:MAG TPA: (d)CMP kinase [Thermodesulfovibrionales bacterium]|jgi:cytidylate kinase|nr:(d)CMP kinase [Thermodesulfovibrionales bacterium]